jgi:hypothetical protein
MQGFFALVFVIAWFSGVAELSLISGSDALNMPIQCDQYLANKHTGFRCVTSEIRFTGLGFIFFALITLLLSVKSKEKTLFIVASYVSFTILSAAIVRAFYFFQGHASVNYLYWSLSMCFSGVLIIYSLKKFPWGDRKNTNTLKNNELEMQRLELEIEERKKERN